jgi:hypothetical protein
MDFRAKFAVVSQNFSKPPQRIACKLRVRDCGPANKLKTPSRTQGLNILSHTLLNNYGLGFTIASEVLSDVL